MKNIKRSYIFIFILILIFIISFGASYAIFMDKSEQHGKLNIVAGDLNYKIESDDLVNNKITVKAGTTKEITLTLTSLNDINSKYELYYILDSSNSDVTVGYSEDTKDSVSGIVDKDGTKKVTIVIKNSSDVSTTVEFGVAGGLVNNELVLTKGNSISELKIYAENILNGATPVLSDNLTPIQISDNGIVTKADLYKEWYSYENKKWANAVVTKNSYDTLNSYGKVTGATKNDGYVSFDGVDDYIDLGLADYDFGNSITMAIRVKFKEVGRTQEFINSMEGAGGGCGISKGGTLYCGYYIDSYSNYYYLTPEDIIEIGKYYTVVLTYDGKTESMYVDGNLVGSSEIEGNFKTSSLPILIGANPGKSNNANFSNIDVKQVAIFDRAVTEEEVKKSFTDDIKIYNSDELLVYEDFIEKEYSNDEVIPEDSIESYFVWIPKYSYQLWDLGDYSTLTAMDVTKPHAIPIKFGLTNTSDSNSGECTTPGVAGESGNCKVGDYMTHPAFLAFDSNGMWVGKFETGYDGATSTATAQVNSSDSSKTIIKPNVYPWRGLTVGNMFKVSYDYLREDDSHAMKNTEWGAVAYLSHSLYGTCNEISGKIFCSEVRLNNNKSYITGFSSTEDPIYGFNNGNSIEGNRVEYAELLKDGTYTINYLNNLSTAASTTKNKSGIYDMSGGSWEYVMGYTTGATTVGGLSTITELYSDFFTNSSWDKYYDKYTSTVNINYNNRILGDAIGEMGPFANQIQPDDSTRKISSWYGDTNNFINPSSQWFIRGTHFNFGSASGLFAASSANGTNYDYSSFRIILAPTK